MRMKQGFSKKAKYGHIRFKTGDDDIKNQPDQIFNILGASGVDYLRGGMRNLMNNNINIS